MAVDQGMELSAFVRTTLVELIKGVQEAIDDVGKLGGGGVINPTGPDHLRSEPKDVDFDVAVIVEQAATDKGGARLKIPAVQIGGDLERTIESKAISRVRFSVPVSAPHTSTSKFSSSRRNYPDIAIT